MKKCSQKTVKKSTLTTLFILTSGIFLTNNVYAHAPELHKKENAEKPKCEAMKNMDHSTMDMNDPIIQAMMKQCMSSDSHNDDDDHKESKKEKHGYHGDMKKPH